MKWRDNGKQAEPTLFLVYRYSSLGTGNLQQQPSMPRELSCSAVVCGAKYTRIYRRTVVRELFMALNDSFEFISDKSVPNPGFIRAFRLIIVGGVVYVV